MRSAVLFAFKLDSGRFDQARKLFTGNVRVHPIAESFLFPAKPGLQVFGFEARTVAPIVDFQQIPRDTVMEFRAGT